MGLVGVLGRVSVAATGMVLISAVVIGFER
jgi:hypothetical protein